MTLRYFILLVVERKFCFKFINYRCIKDFDSDEK